MQSKITKFIAIPIILGVTLLLNIYICSFALASKTYAAEPIVNTAEAESKFYLNIRPTISITVDPEVTIAADPVSNNGISQTTTDLTITTNNRSGYKMYLATTDGTGNLTHETDTRNKIPSTANPLTLNDFAANTWGYNLTKLTTNTNFTLPNDALFSAIPTSTTTNSPQGSSDAPATDTYKLSFGAKIDTSLIAGRYSNIVKISVITEFTPETLLEITDMQQMTPEICSNSTEHETKQLIDTRDSNKYWVAKLKDDNCWMVQNLALDITEQGLRTSDTDISDDWNTNSAYPPSETETSLPNTSINAPASTKSFNLGEWIIKYPERGVSCGAGILGYCSEYFQTVDNTWSDRDGSGNPWLAKNYIQNVDAVSDTFTAMDSANKKYDSHYLAGNYYQWNTATAGTGAMVANSGIANGSICPKGWHLPKTADSDGSFAELLLSYGINDTPKTEMYNVFTWPLYFTNSGYIPGVTGLLNGASNSGYYWSAIASSSAYAGYLAFDTSAVYPMLYYHRGYAEQVRCIAY